MHEVAGPLAQALGLPPGLVAATGGGATNVRESWRMFLTTSVAGIVSIIEPVLRAALDAPDLRLDLTHLTAADLASRTRASGSIAAATKTLVDAGWVRDEALRIAREIAGLEE